MKDTKKIVYAAMFAALCTTLAATGCGMTQEETVGATAERAPYSASSNQTVLNESSEEAVTDLRNKDLRLVKPEAISEAATKQQTSKKTGEEATKTPQSDDRAGTTSPTEVIIDVTVVPASAITTTSASTATSTETASTATTATAAESEDTSATEKTEIAPAVFAERKFVESGDCIEVGGLAYQANHSQTVEIEYSSDGFISLSGHNVWARTDWEVLILDDAAYDKWESDNDKNYGILYNGEAMDGTNRYAVNIGETEVPGTISNHAINTAISCWLTDECELGGVKWYTSEPIYITKTDAPGEITVWANEDTWKFKCLDSPNYAEYENFALKSDNPYKLQWSGCPDADGNPTKFIISWGEVPGVFNEEPVIGTAIALETAAEGSIVKCDAISFRANEDITYTVEQMAGYARYCDYPNDDWYFIIVDEDHYKTVSNASELELAYAGPNCRAPEYFVLTYGEVPCTFGATTDFGRTAEDEIQLLSNQLYLEREAWGWDKNASFTDPLDTCYISPSYLSYEYDLYMMSFSSDWTNYNLELVYDGGSTYNFKENHETVAYSAIYSSEIPSSKTIQAIARMENNHWRIEFQMICDNNLRVSVYDKFTEHYAAKTYSANPISGSILLNMATPDHGEEITIPLDWRIVHVLSCAAEESQFVEYYD